MQYETFDNYEEFHKFQQAATTYAELLAAIVQYLQMARKFMNNKFVQQ